MESPDTDLASASADPLSFEIMPHSVLNSGVSSRAIHLYLILSRYAQNDSGEAWPSRARLASELGFKQARGVDPIIAELEGIGAITVQRGKDATGKNAPNVYRVHRRGEITAVKSQPKSSAPQRTTTPESVVRHSAPSSAPQRTSVVRHSAHELIPIELIPKELRHSAPADAEPVQGVLVGMPADPDGVRASEAREIATILGERHPVLKSKFMAMAKMAERAMKSYGAPMGIVGETMERIFMDGCTPTDVMIGQRLEGIRRGGVRPTKDELIRNTMAMADPPAGAPAPALTADPFKLRITS